MSIFSLKVIACDKVFFEGSCSRIVIPLRDGEKAIESHHENMMMGIEPGEIRITLEDGTILYGVVSIGFVQIMNNRVTVIVSTAEKPEEIDIQRAREAKERAEEQLRQKQSIREYYHTQASLARAMSRLKVSSKGHWNI